MTRKEIQNALAVKRALARKLVEISKRLYKAGDRVGAALTRADIAQVQKEIEDLKNQF